MLKSNKSKLKLAGAMAGGALLCLSYVGISFYAIPGQASAVTWFPQEETRTLADIEYLQDMNKTICDNSKIGDTNNSVKDSRDDNAYSIGKLADGKCWMTQNLRLTRETIKAKDSSNTTGKVTSADTNTNSDYSIPASTTGAFSNTKGDDTHYDNQQVRAAENEIYGAYYSYNVATLNKVWDKDIGQADYDICPKGWRLPTGGSNGEFYTLVNQYPGVGRPTTGLEQNGGFYGYWFGAANTASGGAFFPAAGFMDSSLSYTGSHGYYWSSMINNVTNAYILGFSSSSIGPTGAVNRHLGSSIRCIANENILPNLPTYTDSTSDSIAVKVANTLSIDAVSGMEEEVDSTSVANGTITATIAANTNYKVLLSAEKTSLTSANSANDAEIPASTNVAAGTNAWGILNSDNSTYSAITNQEKEYYNTTAPSTNLAIPGTVHTFGIGISVSPSLPADTYSTEVTITAAAA